MTHSRRSFLRVSLGATGAFGLVALSAGRGAANSERAPAGARRGRAGLRILILGGTRFLGPHQVHYALERGHRVTIFNRGRTVPPFYEPLFDRVEKLRGDRNDDLTALEGREWDAVLDNSASIPRWVRQSASLLADRVAQYLFVSSISAYHDYAEAGIDESYPVATLEDPTIEEVTGRTYGALKALCERETEAAFGDRATVVRPGLIVGPGDNTDRWTYWPVRIDRGGEVLSPGTPDDPVQIIDARDLAEFMIHLLEDRQAGTYNATGPASRLTIGPMLAGIRDALGADAIFTFADADFLQGQDVQPWSHMPAWVPPLGEGMGLLQVGIARALERGLTFRPLDVTARDTLAWWRTLPEERRAEPRAGLSAEREEEVLAAWHAR